jgi:hypothetical protein
MRHYPLDQHAHDPPCRSCKRKGRGDVWHHPNSKDIWSESESEGEGEGEREDENERENEGEVQVETTPAPKLSLWKRFKRWHSDPTRPELLAWRGAQGRQRGDV